MTLHAFIWNSPAWLATSANARCAFLFLLQQFNGHNNGEIVCSVRQVADNLGVGKATAKRAIDELIEHGFIVVAKDSGFNQKGRKAREYRLTHLPTINGNGVNVPASHDYQSWKPFKVVK